MKTKLKKGQTVKLIVGVDKGKTGEIIKLFPKEYSALIKGINVKKKHQKPTKEQKGGIVNIEKPVHLSNLKVMNENKSSKVNKKTEIKSLKNKNKVEQKISKKNTNVKKNIKKTKSKKK
ncbi:MAG: 50S ribosomal protein L24 [Candidatus Pelagibacter sp.]|nr:50S ribosomal protein L24 [Candidatus Pelagibacter sp.]|tara:strand:- start:222 stop:578 length:357 start_codon:yes stop_codon:yes gene_type:complete